MQFVSYRYPRMAEITGDQITRWLGAIYINKNPSQNASQASSSQSSCICPLWFIPQVWVSGACAPAPANNGFITGTETLSRQIFGEFVELDVGWHRIVTGDGSREYLSNVINMGLVTITMGRRLRWEMNSCYSCTVISNIYPVLILTWARRWALMISWIAE